jgi:hypothetical protein
LDFGEKGLYNKHMPTKLIQKGEHFSRKTEFKKGAPSWNKGTHKSGMLGKHRTEDSKRRMSIKMSGSNGTNWKGGISPINKVIRRSVEYRLWRTAVFERDSYTCVWCGQVGGELHPDHIKPFSLYPELRFAIDNGRTLCVKCHKTTNTYGGKVRKYA